MANGDCELKNMSNNCQKNKDKKKIKRKSIPSQKKTKESTTPQFKDEDYIVFGFTEDGVFDILKEKETKVKDTKEEDEFNEIEDSGTLSIGSMELNQSESSSASFSFPVLEWELMGSPTLMPRSQGSRNRDARKHNKLITCSTFHCCRFGFFKF